MISRPLSASVVLAVILLVASAAAAETVRIAVVVGRNAGAPGEPSLRFAESDAGKFAKTLVELGEVDERNLVLLQGRGSATFATVWLEPEALSNGPGPSPIAGSS